MDIQGRRATGNWLRTDRFCTDRFRTARFRSDRGQAAVEFVGMAPIALAVAALLWQAALLGYTFSLAGNAADEAVRAYAVAEGGGGACQQGAERNLPGAWNATASCGESGDLVTASVEVELPLFFPGVNLPINVPGHASAVKEG
ncbi:TadE/TadG family type IV pilus assembly protein [Streptomyces sp. NPDC087850]|uniref:TadE/TadG family type IV pilus assembly protein n=1 Tax=Streptomyces sp. NPDC087850 TaxID=3365809 RepID=UPI003810DFC1